MITYNVEGCDWIENNELAYSPNMGYEDGIIAINQIALSLHSRNIAPEVADKIISHHTFNLLNRTCPGWMR